MIQQELRCACIIMIQTSMSASQKKYSTIRLILGDQLNLDHSWFREVDPSILYVLMEIRPESEYVTHHIQKIVGIFQAMRHFSHQLQKQGHHVRYFTISDGQNQHSFKGNLAQLVEKHTITSAEFMEPDEYRLDQLLSDVFQDLKIPFNKVSSEHFLTTREELQKLFSGKKRFLMETFYREMRRKHDVLMEGDEPAGGRWNFDKENREKLPPDHTPPAPLLFRRHVHSILDEIWKEDLPHLGEIDEHHFPWPVSREEAKKLLGYFLGHLLPNFGTYQDAMSNNYWSIYHSRISFALNIKILHPREVIREVENRWREDPDTIGLAQAEGFIRQILGWREYMRGIYWAHMPEYETLNYFNHERPLPKFFWTGQTRMNCMAKAISQSLEHGYAHHIQRLMVTGNFSLLAGIHPDEVDQWYLGIYIDAFQWVEITNTRGMSQFADGGIVGSKPYVASASYIHKMGDHCSQCHYDRKKRTGEGACPFNSMYWRFIAVNEDKLSNNQRMSMMYRVWHKMSPETKQELLDQADMYLDHIEQL